MKYNFKEFKLKNGIEGFLIIFDDKCHSLLSDFFLAEVAGIEDYFINLCEEIVSDNSKTLTHNGSIFILNINIDTVFISDSISSITISFMDFFSLLKEYKNKSEELKKKNLL